jgi:sulfoxide reductase heme-binding subunit YedZ
MTPSRERSEPHNPGPRPPAPGPRLWWLKRRWLKPLLFLLCLAPVAWLGWRAWNDDLSANPIEFITHFTGDWTIRFLVFTLAITPLRKLVRVPELIRFRRMLGLFAFFYGCLHFLTWLVLDIALRPGVSMLPEMARDVVKRPFIAAGFTAFVLMIPLAITSTAGWIRRLGGRRWAMLHRLVYASAVIGVVHYYWLVKSDIRLPVLYGGLVGLELAYRIID